MPKCPICDAPVKPRADNPDYPFCTSRCKMIDLGKWVNEEYRIGAEDSGEDEGEAPEPEAESSDDASKKPVPVRH